MVTKADTDAGLMAMNGFADEEEDALRKAHGDFLASHAITSWEVTEVSKVGGSVVHTIMKDPKSETRTYYDKIEGNSDLYALFTERMEHHYRQCNPKT